MERQAFTISRATWHRGKSAFGSKLLIRSLQGVPLEADCIGKMCCLGSIALQCGATADEIADIETPARLNDKRTLPAFAPLLHFKNDLAYHTVVARSLMKTNDDDAISDAEREAELTRLAATIGWDLTFTD